jgi:hypothetical protein
MKITKSKKWLPPLKKNSKKVKLPKQIIVGVDKKGKEIIKKLWVKGKSKFLHIRLHDEGKTCINQL